MILVLTGRFSEKDAEKVLSHFTGRENGASPQESTRPGEQSKPAKLAVIEKAGVAQAYLCFGLRTVPAKHSDTPALDLINSVLGMGESSRLFRELREKRALTYDFSSINASGLDYGYFSINLAVKAASLNQTQSIIHGEWEKLKAAPVGDEELEKSKNLVLGDIFRAMDSFSDLPRILADMEIYFEDQNALTTYIQKIQALTPQTCRKPPPNTSNKKITPPPSSNPNRCLKFKAENKWLSQ